MIDIANLKDNEISFDLVKKDVNYDDFMFLIRHLVHELKRLGADGFIAKYDGFLEDDVPYEQKAFVCGMFRHLGYIGELDFTPDCLVLMYGEWWDYSDNDFSLKELIDLYNNALPAFKQYGVMYVKTDTFADGTSW